MIEVIEKNKIINNLDVLKETLNIFGFTFSNDKLKNIKVNSLDKDKISFIDEVTGEKYFAMYTNSLPSYDVNPSYLGGNRKFLVQKIEKNGIMRFNWYDTTDGIIHNSDGSKPIKVIDKLLIEKVFCHTKLNDKEYVLEIQKDYPKAEIKKNIDINVYEGPYEKILNFDKYGITFEGNSNYQLIRNKYGLDKDYSFFQIGSPYKGELYEFRYMYGRNFGTLTNHKENVFEDKRMIYGFSHISKGQRYSGVISEDGSKEFENICPLIEDSDLPYYLKQLDDKNSISKIYFKSDILKQDKITYIWISKNDLSIDINVFNRLFENDGWSNDIKHRIISIPNLSNGTITEEEINNIIDILKKCYIEEAIYQLCKELEIFINVKRENEEIKHLNFEVNDICNPRMAINFDTDDIVQSIIVSKEDKTISSMLNRYNKMFRTEVEDVQTKKKILK